MGNNYSTLPAIVLIVIGFFASVFNHLPLVIMCGACIITWAIVFLAMVVRENS